MAKNIELAILDNGHSFGEVALIEQKPRLATIRCLQDSHFAVLSKKDFNKVLGIIERKKYNEKIQFLRSLPYFSQLTRASLGKLIYQFTDIKTLKDQILFREGEPSDFVYLVKEGQFEVSRSLMHPKKPIEEQTKTILSNPLRSLKVTNTKALSVSRSAVKPKIYVSLLCNFLAL